MANPRLGIPHAATAKITCAEKALAQAIGFRLKPLLIT